MSAIKNYYHHEICGEGDYQPELWWYRQMDEDEQYQQEMGEPTEDESDEPE